MRVEGVQNRALSGGEHYAGIYSNIINEREKNPEGPNLGVDLFYTPRRPSGTARNSKEGETITHFKGPHN
jgi:hypothetical protein